MQKKTSFCKKKPKEKSYADYQLLIYSYRHKQPKGEPFQGYPKMILYLPGYIIIQMSYYIKEVKVSFFILWAFR